MNSGGNNVPDNNMAGKKTTACDENEESRNSNSNGNSHYTVAAHKLDLLSHRQINILLVANLIILTLYLILHLISFCILCCALWKGSYFKGEMLTYQTSTTYDRYSLFFDEMPITGAAQWSFMYERASRYPNI